MPTKFVHNMQLEWNGKMTRKMYNQILSFNPTEELQEVSIYAQCKKQLNIRPTPDPKKCNFVSESQEYDQLREPQLQVNYKWSCNMGIRPIKSR